MGVAMSGPPFRADHVGSLLRPRPLLAAREEHEKGWITAATLRGCEDDCIKKAVEMQAELGLEGVTDGEFRRGSWHMDFMYQIGGVTRTDQTLRIQFRNEAGPVEAALGAFGINGKLSLDKTIFGEDFAYLKSVAAAASSTGMPTRTWTRSGTTSPKSTKKRSPGSPRSAALIYSSTTRASPTSMTRRSAPMSTRSAATASTST